MKRIYLPAIASLLLFVAAAATALVPATAAQAARADAAEPILAAPGGQAASSIHEPLAAQAAPSSLADAFLPVAFGPEPAERLTIASSPLPLGPGGEWRLIFADEFEGGQDLGRWTPCFYWGDESGCETRNSELEWYAAANVSRRDGALVLQARREAVAGPGGKTFNYTSGMVTTDRLTPNLSVQPGFAFQYGYVELRAKLPAGRGLWPAFWLLPNDHSAAYEIDVLEVLGHEPDRLHMHYHYRDAAGADVDHAASWRGPDFSAGWHTFGVEWRADAIIWYVDGMERSRYADAAHISTLPMHLIANLAVGGDWPGAPDSSTPFPSSFVVDYVRVWSRPGDNRPAALDANLLRNASFERAEWPRQLPWRLEVKTGAAAQLALDGGAPAGSSAASVRVTQSTGTDWHVQLAQPYLPVSAGQTYTLSFWARAATSRTISVVIQQDYAPYTEYLRQAVDLSTGWQRFTLSFTSPVTDDDLKLSFGLGAAPGQLWFDGAYFGR